MKWYLSIKDEVITGAYGEKILDELIEYEGEEDFDRTHYKYSDGNVVAISNEERNVLYSEEMMIEQEQQLSQMMLAYMRVSLLNDLPDEEAVDIPLCYTAWDSFSEGYEFTKGKRVEHKGGLWKCKQGHKKQSSWYPGAEPTLWEQLDKENHTGTQEDPIPVPDSVTTSGFTYIYGKYYSEASKTYLFKRGGIPDEQAEAMYGQSETLYFPPSALVGSYSVIV